MKLLALEAPPAHVSHWEKKTTLALTQAHEAENRLIRFIRAHMSEQDEGEACGLLDKATQARNEMFQLTLQELAFSDWATAFWYRQSTGTHIETGTPDGLPKPTVDGNVYDIREILNQRTRKVD